MGEKVAGGNDMEGTDEAWKLTLPSDLQGDTWAWIHHLRQLFAQIIAIPDCKSLPTELAGAPAYLRRMATRMGQPHQMKDSLLLCIWIEAFNKAFLSPSGGGAFMEIFISMPAFSSTIIAMASQDGARRATERLNTIINNAVADRRDRLLHVQNYLLADTEALLLKHWPAIVSSKPMRIPFSAGTFIVNINADQLVLDIELLPEMSGMSEMVVLPAATFKPRNPEGRRLDLSAGFSGINEWSLDMDSLRFLIDCVKVIIDRANERKNPVR